MFAGTDQEPWAMFAERERRWLFGAIEWLLRRGRPSEEAAQRVSGKRPRHEVRGGRSVALRRDLESENRSRLRFEIEDRWNKAGGREVASRQAAQVRGKSTAPAHGAAAGL